MDQGLKSHRLAARLFGIFFIIAIASYGAGAGLVASITGNELGFDGVSGDKHTLMIGVMQRPSWVLADNFELVSAWTVRLSFMTRKVRAIQQVRRRDWL